MPPQNEPVVEIESRVVLHCQIVRRQRPTRLIAVAASNLPPDGWCSKVALRYLDVVEDLVENARQRPMTSDVAVDAGRQVVEDRLDRETISVACTAE